MTPLNDYREFEMYLMECTESILFV